MTLAENLVNGMNNPDCAFYVGATIGQYLVLRILSALVLAYFLIRILDKLVFTPLLNWISKKINGGKK